MRTVYLQLGSDGQLLNSNIFAAFEGFSKKMYDIKFFNILAPANDKDAIVCGNIPAVKEAWRHLGVRVPVQLDYPDELKQFLDRNVWTSTVQEAHNEIWQAVYTGEDKKLFIKPKINGKLFTGHVIDSKDTKTLQKSLVDMDTIVWLSETVEFISEYRIFVHNNEIVGAKNYFGDFTILPDWDIVKNAISSFAHAAPIAYSLDMGVTKDNFTLLVEVNDCYSLGYYGLNTFTYANMIEARWDEVVNTI